MHPQSPSYGPCVSLCAVLLLLATSCLHRRTVVFDHDIRTGQDTITYRGKPMTPEELFELGEKADDNQIDLIMKQDGTTQKVDLKKWHTGMRMLPEVMQSMPEGSTE